MTIKTQNTTFIVSETEVLCTRIINSRLVSLTVEVDGTIGDLGRRVTNVTKLSDDMFIDFSEIVRNR